MVKNPTSQNSRTNISFLFTRSTADVLTAFTKFVFDIQILDKNSEPRAVALDIAMSFDSVCMLALNANPRATGVT